MGSEQGIAYDDACGQKGNGAFVFMGQKSEMFEDHLPFTAERSLQIEKRLMGQRKKSPFFGNEERHQVVVQYLLSAGSPQNTEYLGETAYFVAETVDGAVDERSEIKFEGGVLFRTFGRFDQIPVTDMIKRLPDNGWGGGNILDIKRYLFLCNHVPQDSRVLKVGQL